MESRAQGEGWRGARSRPLRRTERLLRSLRSNFVNHIFGWASGSLSDAGH